MPGGLAGGLVFQLPVGLCWWLRSPSSSAPVSAFPLHWAKTAEGAGRGVEIPE